METALAHHKCPADLLVRADQLEAEFLAQRTTVQFRCEEGIGPSLDDEPIVLFGEDLAAEACVALDEDDRHTGLDESAGGGQPGNSSSDHDDRCGVRVCHRPMLTHRPGRRRDS